MEQLDKNTVPITKNNNNFSFVFMDDNNFITELVKSSPKQCHRSVEWRIELISPESDRLRRGEI